MNISEALPNYYDSLGRTGTLTFISPAPTKLLQARLDVEGALNLVLERAAQLRESSTLPFWDAVNVSCFDQGRVVKPLLEEALFHNHNGESWEIPIKSLSTNWIRQVTSRSADRMVAVSSKIEIESGKHLHTPMLDFHCPASDQNLQLVLAALESLKVGKGMVVASGKSYHFYGGSLISRDDLGRFLARALLLAPIIDRAWIAHQLYEGACALRVSPRPESGEPKVIAHIGS